MKTHHQYTKYPRPPAPHAERKTIPAQRRAAAPRKPASMGNQQDWMGALWVVVAIVLFVIGLFTGGH